MKSKYKYLLITLVALVADQLTKAWATASLQSRGSLAVIDGLFRLSYARNRGVAFSLFADSEFNIQWVLAAISALAALAVVGYLIRTSAFHKRLNLALSLLLAGEVVDFLDFHWGERFTWPTFNLADAMICIGAALLALELMKEDKVAGLQSQATNPAPEESGISPSE